MGSRIRTVKPELFRHEALFEAERESQLPLRFAFIGLFTVADREGRFRWRPRQIKLDLLPYDDLDMERVLDALATCGFVVRYESGGEHYGCIPTWHKHQVINNRELASILPAPTTDASATRDARVEHASGTRDARGLGSPQAEGEGEPEGDKSQNPLSELKSSSDVAGGKSRNPKSQPSREAEQLSQLLRSEILRNKPDFRITLAQVHKWAVTADRMIRLDGRASEGIASVIRWAQHDGFEHRNVLSMDKLRERFDQLELKSQQRANGKGHRAEEPPPRSAWEKTQELLASEKGARS